MAFPTFYCDISHLAAPCKEMEVDLAEAVGFEPTVPVKVQRFSRPPQSTTLPRLRGWTPF